MTPSEEYLSAAVAKLKKQLRETKLLLAQEQVISRRLRNALGVALNCLIDTGGVDDEGYLADHASVMAVYKETAGKT